MGSPGDRGGLPAPQPVTGPWQQRVVQPYQAHKQYRCPGCDHEIRPRTLHLVVWPDGDPDRRRHWHRPCWERHRTRRAGRPAGGRPHR